MKRSAVQRTRRFLATSFGFDSFESVSYPPHTTPTTMYRIEFPNITGALSDSCVGLVVAMFDNTKGCFFGASHHCEVGGAGLLFHAPPGVSLVIEALRVNPATGIDAVAAWVAIPLAGLTERLSLVLLRGCAQMMLLDKSVWIPPDVPSCGTLELRCVLPSHNSLRHLLPPGMFVLPEYCDSTAPLPLFRVQLSRLVISDKSLPDQTPALDSESTWNCLLLVHNTRRLIAKAVEVRLTLESDGLVSNREVEFSDLPMHSDTSLVCVLRYKKARECRFFVYGYAVFDLVTGTPQFKDIDLNVSSLPFLRGPFSCEDPRTLSLECDRKYEVLPLELSLRVGYFETPIPAQQVEEIEYPTGYLAPVTETLESPQLSSEPGYEPASEPLAMSRSRISRKASIVSRKASSPATLGELGAPPFLSPVHPPQDVYRLLTDILNEVKEVKRVQDIMKAQHYDAQDQTNLETAAQRAIPLQDIIELHPRCVALPYKRRLALEEHLRPIVHPQTGERLTAIDLCAGDKYLPNEQLHIRFEGITFMPHGFELPKSIFFQFSFLSLPLQSVGVLYTSTVYAADGRFGPTYSVSPSDHGGSAGAVWCEPPSSAQCHLYNSIKRKLTLYIHLYDAETWFYIATANLPLSIINRPAGTTFTSKQIDLPMYEDLSLSARIIPDETPLIIASNIGQLHLTLAFLGLPASDGFPIMGERTSPMLPRSPAGGGRCVVVAKKLDIGLNDDTPSVSVAPRSLPSVGPFGFDAQCDERANIHLARIKYVRSLLEDKDTNELAKKVNGGKITLESEVKLRYVEKIRDEVKCNKIAVAMRERITTELSIVVWCGHPTIIETIFVNPYPATMEYTLEIPSSSRHLKLYPDSPSIFRLGPKQEHVVKLVSSLFRCPDYNEYRTQAIVRNQRMEVCRIIDVKATIVPAVVHRRYQLIGEADMQLRRRVHMRYLPPLVGINKEALGDLCHHIVVSDKQVAASSRAAVEPITPNAISAREELVLQTTVSTERSVLIHLFKDRHYIEHYETWELSFLPCPRLETRTVILGQSSIVALPLVLDGDRLCVNDRAVQARQMPECQTLKVRPSAPGTSTLLLHALRGFDIVSRHLVSIPCNLPLPTYEDNINVPITEAALPVLRRLTFINQEPVDRVYRVQTNYPGNISVQPTEFFLVPQESKQLAICIQGLNHFGGEGTWPMWIFINDSDDRTVDSYLINVSVRQTLPFSP